MNERRKSDPHPLEIERWLLDEASDAQRQRVEGHFDRSEQAALRASDQKLRASLEEAHPAAAFAARVRLRAAAAPRRVRSAPSWLAAGGGILVAAAAAVVVLRPSPSTPRHDGHLAQTSVTHDPAALAPGLPTERTKGVGLDLRVYRKRADGVERLLSGAEAAPREVLQLGYLRDGYTHGVLLSIDGRGAVTVHFPHTQDGSTQLGDGGGEQLLGDAYELDDAPSFERFVFVASAQPLVVDEVLAAARRVAADPTRAQNAVLELTVTNAQRSLLLRKSAPR